MATNRAIKSQITMEEQGDTSKLFVRGSRESLLSLLVGSINTVNISDGVVSRDHGAPSL